jgi:hypothetical protein
VGCHPSFSFFDGAGDDVPPDALEAFFLSLPLEPTDFIRFSLEQGGVEMQWCAERADLYRDAYLEMSRGYGTMFSNGWLKWYRSGSEGWSDPISTPYPNHFGSACYLPYSWCGELGLNQKGLGVSPASPGLCEAFELGTGCGGQLTITIGHDRLTACGF